MASRSLLGVYRVLNPSLLPKKDRGKYADVSVAPLSYGQQEVTKFIPGTEYLDDEIQSSSDEWEEIVEGSQNEDQASGSDMESENSMYSSVNDSTSANVSERRELNELLTEEQWEKLQDIQKDMIQKNPTQFGLKRRLAELYNVDAELDPDDLLGIQKKK